MTHEVQLVIAVTTPDDVEWSAVEDKLIDVVLKAHDEESFFIEGIISNTPPTIVAGNFEVSRP